MMTPYEQGYAQTMEKLGAEVSGEGLGGVLGAGIGAGAGGYLGGSLGSVPQALSRFDDSARKALVRAGHQVRPLDISRRLGRHGILLGGLGLGVSGGLLGKFLGEVTGGAIDDVREKK